MLRQYLVNTFAGIFVSLSPNYYGLYWKVIASQFTDHILTL